jgi:hypothetical protein
MPLNIFEFGYGFAGDIQIRSLTDPYMYLLVASKKFKPGEF